MFEWKEIKFILIKREHSLTYKALSAKTPQYLSDLFTVSSDNTYQLGIFQIPGFDIPLLDLQNASYTGKSKYKTNKTFLRPLCRR